MYEIVVDGTVVDIAVGLNLRLRSTYMFNGCEYSAGNNGGAAS